MNFFGAAFSLFLGLHALFFFALGAIGIITKKPVLISKRLYYSYLLNMLLATTAPVLLNLDFLSMMASIPLSPSLILLIAISFVNLIIFYLLMGLRGYAGCGTTDSSFREGLTKTLKKLKIPFEEHLDSIYLSSIGANLRLEVDKYGVHTIYIRPRKFNNVLRKIVQSMNRYYQTANVPIDFTTFYWCMFCGVVLMIYAYAIVFKPFSISYY